MKEEEEGTETGTRRRREEGTNVPTYSTPHNLTLQERYDMGIREPTVYHDRAFWRRLVVPKEVPAEDMRDRYSIIQVNIESSNREERGRKEYVLTRTPMIRPKPILLKHKLIIHTLNIRKIEIRLRHRQRAFPSVHLALRRVSFIQYIVEQPQHIPQRSPPNPHTSHAISPPARPSPLACPIFIHHHHHPIHSSE